MKTQKTEKRGFKKRALVSSVAMLLVATVAVGSATFAWFTSNKSVTADGMKVTASAAQGLQITGNNGANWGPTYSFQAAERKLQPVSLNYTIDDVLPATDAAYYPGEAKITGPWTAAQDKNFLDWKSVKTADIPKAAISGEAISAKNAAGDYFVAYEIGVRNSSTAAGDKLDNVKVRVNFTGEAASYARAAIIKQSGNRTTVDYTADNVAIVYGNAEAGKNLLINAIEPAVSTKTAVLTAPSATNAASDKQCSVITNKPTYYTLLVWYEGQDVDCIDDNQAKSTNISITFYYE